MQKSPEYAPRTLHGYRLYEAAFGDAIKDAKTIADVGAGDSNFARTIEQRYPGKEVWRFDAQYQGDPPTGDRFEDADARHLDGVPDEAFDLALSAFMFQHITHGNGDAARAMMEMIRITKTADPKDDSRGNIMIFPVWRYDRLRELLVDNFSDDIAMVGYPEIDALHNVDKRLGDKRTLLIRKTPHLTAEKAQRLTSMIEFSRVLDRRETPVTLGRRALIVMTGNTHRHTSNQ